MCLADDSKSSDMIRRRRGKRDKSPLDAAPSVPAARPRKMKKKPDDDPIQALLPSLFGVVILIFAIMAKMGFRGRASVAGIDLGTTNSVVCVQAPAKGVGEIECIPPVIVPSVISLLESSERPVGPSTKIPSTLNPHPTNFVVGQSAKNRIATHPHTTFYHAKRVLGRSFDDVQDFAKEVEFAVVPDGQGGAAFSALDFVLSPSQVGSYLLWHLMRFTSQHLGHENIKSAVISVPAKFTLEQRRDTQQAFVDAGIQVARVVEEPTAAALAYGLHKKENVNYILVYDFGGGTLDVSLLYVTDGFVDVMGSDGDDQLGGADFDVAIAHVLGQKHSKVVDRVSWVLQRLEKEHVGEEWEEQLVQSCPALADTPPCTLSSLHTLGEELKIDLSSGNDVPSTTTCFDIADEAATLETVCGALAPIQLEMTHDMFQTTSQKLFDRSLLPVKRLLNDLDLNESEIDEIVMVGGTTRMPQIRVLVHEALPSAQLNVHIDPDITVAYGAASVID